MPNSIGPLRLSEQVDKTGRKLTYSWMLDAPRHFTLDQDWHYIPGYRCRGCHVTNSLKAARAVAARFHLTVVSNGTHAVHRAPLKLRTVA